MENLWKAVNFVQAVLVAAWSVACISMALVARVLTGSPRLPLAMARILWAPPLFWLAGVRLEVHQDKELVQGRPLLFVSNHQSIFDIPVLFVAVGANLRFVAKHSLRRVPFLGWFMSAVGMVFVERSRSRRASESVDQASEVLESGGWLVTFPEGTRSVDGGVGPFKPAAVAPAIATGVAVVPVAIDGAYRVLPRGGFRVRPGTIRVSLGRPIETVGLSAQDRHELSRELRDRVVSARSPSRTVAEPSPRPEVLEES